MSFFWSLVDSLGKILDWTPVRKAELVAVSTLATHFYFLVGVLIMIMANIELINSKVAGYFCVYSIVVMLLSSVLALMCHLKKKAVSHENIILPRLSLILFAISMVISGYFSGMLSFSAGLVLMGSPIIGFILFERALVYLSLFLSIVAMCTIEVLTSLHVIPYAPLISVDMGLTAATNTVYALLTLIFSLPTFLIILLLGDTSLYRWRQRENEIKTLSMTDLLTELPNRRAISTYLEQRVAVSRRNHVPLSIIILDLDFFKSINDTHGHQIGDLTLKRVAEAIQSGLRQGDQVGRYGGEEFLIVLEAATWDDAELVAERCRINIMNLDLCNHKGVVVSTTASLGACSNENNTDMYAPQMLKFADDALYLAKELGRNKVCLAKEIADTLIPILV